MRRKAAIRASAAACGVRFEPMEQRIMLAADVIISEIMYHPASENNADEWFELFNRGDAAADLTGWTVSRGVSFEFPSMMLGAGQRLVVAANTARFNTNYPAVTNVVGGWTGQLSNNGEDIEIEDSTGARMDLVSYADQGDWAMRVQGPDDAGHRGWDWQAAHDGLGRSLELINAGLSNNHGQNWASSTVVGGTPGAANSAAATDIAPMILDVTHFPVVPSSSDPVTVTAKIIDELTSGLSVTLHHRNDGQANFTTATMFDDGLHGDGAAGDGVWGASIPPQANGTVVEFYVRAVDAGMNARNWPAPAQLAASGGTITTPDGSGGGHDGVLFNGALISPGVGQFGAGALRLDGTNDYVQLEQSASNDLGLSSFTLALWFRRDGTGDLASTGSGGVNGEPLLAKGRAGGDAVPTDMNWFLGLNPSGGTRLVADFEEHGSSTSPGLNHLLTGTTTITNGVWHHAAATFDNATGQWTLYLNGNIEAQAVVNGTPNFVSTQRAAIGATLNEAGVRDGALNGLIDEVWIMSDALTQGQIQALMNANTPSGMVVGQWAMDSSSASAGTTAQVTNALYQVVNGFATEPAATTPGAQPLYYIIMTNAERAELANIGDGPEAEALSNAQMNATFISIDGSGQRIHYNTGVRNRGNGSRVGPPNNYRVNFRHDDPWNDVTALNINAYYTHAQIAGSAIFQLAGLVSPDAQPAEVRINGTDLAQPGGPRMFGSYVALEVVDSDFADHHFPNDPNGNAYRAKDENALGGNSDLGYEGPDPDAYRDTYSKLTNQSEDDWSDLINLTNVLNNAPDATFLQAVSQVIDIEQWMRFIALDSLLGNLEGGLQSGRGDDFNMYRGIDDPRFVLIPHDLDSILAQGGITPQPNRDIFSYDDVAGLSRLLSHRDTVGLYYAAFLDLIENVFNPQTLNPLLDQILGSWVSAATINTMKQFIVNRTAGVLSQIPTSFSINSTLPFLGEFRRTTTATTTLTGTAHAAYTRTVLVNGAAANWNTRNGTWSAAGVALNPGVNRVIVEALDADNHLIDSGFMDIWYDDGNVVPVSGTLVGSPPKSNVHLTVPAGYLPGVPILVRVELQDDNGDVDKSIWDATATLSTNRPDVQLSTTQVQLYNGLGTALVTVTGSGGGGTLTDSLIPLGSTWSYRDNGTNQGGLGTKNPADATWFASPLFNDTGWASGPAQLGYGDGDEATVVSFGPQSNNKYATTYFRHEFNVADPSVYTAMAMRLIYDDAGAVYLNGIEIARTPNLPANVQYNQYATSDSPGDNAVFNAAVPVNLLTPGLNVLAVEIHQGDGQSSDISFDFRLTADRPAGGGPVGDFTLTATVLGNQASKPVASLESAPVTTVSGSLGGSATWSGVIRVTGDLLVPDGATLTINPGTLILINGNATPLSTNGVDIDVQGAIQALGTVDSPITFTAFDPAAPWGEIHHDGAEPSLYQYVNINRAGHAPRGGHTNTGPAIRTEGNSNITFDHVNITDIAGKIMQGSGGNLVFTDSVLARAAMGPEITGAGVLFEQSWSYDMLGIYREDGVNDDDDLFYVHRQGTGQTIRFTDSVFAHADDDGIDSLGADIIVDNSIIRDIFDKGITVIRGDNVYERLLIVNAAIGISAKVQNTADAADHRVDHVTIVAGSMGIQSENKDGVPNAVIPFHVSNSIIQAPMPIRTDYNPNDIFVEYSLLNTAWANGSNNIITSNPLFVNAAARDYRLQATSPAVDAGDPGAPLDPDGTRSDMGVFPYDHTAAAGAGAANDVLIWTAAAGPYHVTADTTVPAGLTLIIEPGTSVYFNENAELIVRGELIAQGQQYNRIRFTSVPNAPFVPDQPDGAVGLPAGPPRWDGIHFQSTMSEQNVIAYADIEYAQDANGSIGAIQSQLLVDHVTFRGTHLRMFYGDRSNVIVQNSWFPNMFAAGESPDALGLDNISEHVKGVGLAPAGGHVIIRNNMFGTNKGHNDIIDYDSGRQPNGDVIVQILGNVFTGGGDEMLDLGGDVYVAGNLFMNIFKDDETSDRGYANAISTGDLGPDTTVVVARNIFFDVDHAVNLKRTASTIFEHNTVLRIHPDFNDRFGNPNVGGAINLYVDEPGATAGRGAYVEGNVFHDLPRLFSNPDRAGSTSALQVSYNMLDPAMSLAVGTRPGTVMDLGVGNVLGDPRFVNEPATMPYGIVPSAMLSNPTFVADMLANFELRPGPAADGLIDRFGQPLGHTAPEGAYIMGEPVGTTDRTSVTLTIGGPGIFAYRYRVNGGTWSAAAPVGAGFVPNATVRTANLTLNGLTDGNYTVEVIGQDFAGGWQTVPTVSRTWTVATTTGKPVVINEVLASNAAAFNHAGTFPDAIELYNHGANPVDLGGMYLTDDPTNQTKFSFAPGTMIQPGEYLVLIADGGGVPGAPGIHLPFELSARGEGVYLYDSAANGGVLLDSIEFGIQLTDASLGRVAPHGEWRLNTPTLGAANTAMATGDPATLLINEWFTSGQVKFLDDFIELYNPDALPVDLGGLHLTDNPQTVPDKHAIAPHTFAAGGGFIVFDADDDEGAGPDHLNFQLSAEQGMIGLFSADLSLIDQVLYLNQAPDVSQGRLPDGADTYAFFPLPTPGLSNSTMGQPAFTLLLENLRITELHYHPAEVTGLSEFIELRNIGDEAINLLGVRLTNAVEFTFGDVALNPGQYILVVRDTATFEATYGPGLNVAGQYSGALSNSGEQVVLRLPDPFEAAILRFDYSDNWYPSTDGGGPSLVIVDPTRAPVTWGDKLSWRPSFALGGSPGADDLPETTPPTVLSVAFNDVNPDSIIVQFSENVGPSLQPADLLLENQTTSTVIDPAHIAVAYNAMTNTATFTFPGLTGGHLLAGRYLITLPAVGITDASGNALDGNGNGTGGDNYATQLLIALRSDVNYDDRVNITDLSLLATRFGTSSGATREMGDIDGDGDVDITDLSLLATDFGATRALAAGGGGGAGDADLLNEAEGDDTPANRQVVFQPVTAFAPSTPHAATNWGHISGALDSDDDAVDLLA